MGTYTIPRNYKGETRLLYIFTVKSLITTAAGGLLGSIFYLIFGIMLKMQVVGFIFIGVFALIGFCAGTFKIPTLPGIPFTKNVGGESVDEIIKRWIMFKTQNKKYAYYITKEEE